MDFIWLNMSESIDRDIGTRADVSCLMMQRPEADHGSIQCQISKELIDLILLQ